MTAAPASYKVLDGAEAFSALQPDWEALEANGADHFFQTHAYLRLWQRTVGTPTGAEPLIVVLREGDRVVGIFPACRTRQSGLPMLTWLGGPQALDYGDVLLDTQAAETPVDDFVAESLRLLSKHSRGSVIYLPNVRADARAIEPLRSRLRVFREGAAPYVPIVGTWEEYVATRSPKMRRSIALGRHICERGEGEFQLLAAGDEGVEQAIEQMVAFKRQRYDAPGTRTNLFDEHYVRLRTEQATTDPGSRVAIMLMDGVCVAAALQTIFRERCYCLVTSFDAEYSKYSPGIQLQGFIIRGCYENGWDPCDFCSGDEAYKYRFTDQEVALTTFVSHDAKGALFSAAAATRRRVAEVLGGGSAGKKPSP